MRPWARQGAPACALGRALERQGAHFGAPGRARVRPVERTLALADFACALHASTRMQRACKVGAGVISLKSFFQKDFNETAMWRIIYIYMPPSAAKKTAPARGAVPVPPPATGKKLHGN